MNPPPLRVDRRASFSADRRYRYSLTRTWTKGSRLVAVLLNPSVANETRDDPTTTFCMRRAAAWGFASYEAVNLFALVDTDPRGLRTVSDPVGPRNNAAIRRAVRRADAILVAWGKHGMLLDRAETVLAMLGDCELLCFGRNTDGSPRFPRALPRTITPQVYRAARSR